MPDFAVLAIGGLFCGLMAGAAAQYGRLCTFAAIEDFIAARDLRRARAWALALAVAILVTHVLVATGHIEPARSSYTNGRLDLGGLIVGSVMFGFGMAMIGTCGFGLLVRSGTGDLRATLMAAVVGIAAFAATGGPLASPRMWLSDVAVVRLGGTGEGTLTFLASRGLGETAATAIALLLPLGLLIFGLWSARVRKRLRLLAAAIPLGAAIAGGWIVTGILADAFGSHRLESLTFVAPLGRVLLVTMGESLANSGFAVLSVFGVALGSFAVALVRDELRWEAFDDQREMRRHILGAVLMGIGGVLARGCTIGQGMSAASMLAISAPIAIAGMVLGARLGLAYLMSFPRFSIVSRRAARRRGDQMGRPPKN
jgi:uncharacterized membrane protein YedE/YeeE